MIIREATPDDAEQLIAHAQHITNEPDSNMPWAPGEFQIGVEEEREILSDYAGSDNSVFLVAEISGRIIGVLTCRGGKRQAMRHCASFGMSVARDWRNQGVGTTLLEHLIIWAKETANITRLELEVYTRNETAIYLYRKFGFVEEGRRRKAYFLREEYIDSILMALLL